METFQNKVGIGIYGDDNAIIGSQKVMSSEFITEYINAANRYAEFNNQANHGNTHYWRSTPVAPFCLQKLIRDTYGK